MTAQASGPLAGLRVLELASLAPGPFAATMLSDLGAQVLRIDRRTPSTLPEARVRSSLPYDKKRPPEPLSRGRRSAGVDLKNPDGVATVLGLIEDADVLIEGFRPGVCERLGIGPDACLARNPRLIYARVTGWGQTGPMAARAGHDIDYLAIAGALEPLGPMDGPPVPPLNYVADFGGGGMLAVVGILAALHERERSGRGQVIDAAMVDGVGLLTAFVRGFRENGLWPAGRGTNPFDGTAPFYRSYACSDGRFVAVGAIEPQFYAALLDGLGLSELPADEELPAQWDRAGWPVLTTRFTDIFATQTRDEWAARFEATDACVAPVLDFDEAAAHPQLSYIDVAGRPQPAPAPKFSRTPGRVQGPAPHPGEHEARWL